MLTPKGRRVQDRGRGLREEVQRHDCQREIEHKVEEPDHVDQMTEPRLFPEGKGGTEEFYAGNVFTFAFYLFKFV